MANWSIDQQRELEESALMAKAEDRHFKYGSLPEKEWVPLETCNTQAKTYRFPKGAYLVNPRTGEMRSTIRKQWGKSKREQIKCKILVGENDEIKFKLFKKTHLILAATFPHIEIPETVDHIDGKHQDNEVFNLEAVSRSVNSQRLHASEKGQLASKKGGKRKGKMTWQLDGKTKKRIKSFESVNEAAKVTGINGGHKFDRGNITQALQKGWKAGGFYWEYDESELEPSRKGPIDGIELVIKYYEDLPKKRKDLIQQSVSGYNGTSIPPKAVTNFGEVLTNNDKWTIGDIRPRSSKKYKFVNHQRVHKWIMLYFHENDEDIKEFIESKVEILHKDGDETDPECYDINTHEDQDESKPYTNYSWTLHFGTSKENRKDSVHAQKRRKLT